MFLFFRLEKLVEEYLTSRNMADLVLLFHIRRAEMDDSSATGVMATLWSTVYDTVLNQQADQNEMNVHNGVALPHPLVDQQNNDGAEFVDVEVDVVELNAVAMDDVDNADDVDIADQEIANVGNAVQLNAMAMDDMDNADDVEIADQDNANDGNVQVLVPNLFPFVPYDIDE
ncbi:uncharacterized protein LOC121811355 [Salvia splendens]|uniref:uncharacterized protein LOC121811355 n=1 Tax=Salvia splendens TaxID=180675 RepID=UPI001C265CC1|nr:uncharacterized protein LOC121811355 [Salvia splendens]